MAARKTSQQTKVRVEDLRGMKTGEVAEVARQSGVQNVEGMNKEQLIQAISGGGDGGGGESPSQPGRNGGMGDTPPPPGTDPKQWKDVPGNQS